MSSLSILTSYAFSVYSYIAKVNNFLNNFITFTIWHENNQFLIIKKKTFSKSVSVGTETEFLEVEAGAALLFSIFKDTETVTKAHSLHIQRIFGPFPSSAATKACKITNHIVNMLPDKTLELLNVNSSANEDDRAEFGENLHFSQRRVEPPREDELSWLDFPNGDNSEPLFSMKYVEPRGQKIEERVYDKGFNASWLKEQLEKCYGKDQTEIGLSVTELCTTVFDLLASNKTNDELQNLVCSLWLLLSDFN